LAFRHELGRLAVASTVPGGRAQLLHARILRALAGHDADLSQLVHHATHAHDVAALLEYAPRAAERATLAGSHREAVAHLTTALPHAGGLRPAERAPLLAPHARRGHTPHEVSAPLASPRA